jgi:hypothetical protein
MYPKDTLGLDMGVLDKMGVFATTDMAFAWLVWNSTKM